MKTSLLKSLTLLACLAAMPLATGCGKSSPTAPVAAPEPEPVSVMHTDVRFDYVAVMNDGDFIGDGEFEFRFGVNGVNTVTSKTLGTDDVLNLGYRRTVDGEGSTITVLFESSEWDVNVLGNDRRDPDMDKRVGIRTYNLVAGLGGQHAITLGNDNCRVKLYYSLITYTTVAPKNPKG